MVGDGEGLDERGAVGVGDERDGGNGVEVVPRAQLWDRAQQIAGEIARRRPEAIQGTVRAIWESLDMTRSVALRNGLSYTHIGNDDTHVPDRNALREPETR